MDGRHHHEAITVIREWSLLTYHRPDEATLLPLAKPVDVTGIKWRHPCKLTAIGSASWVWETGDAAQHAREWGSVYPHYVTLCDTDKGSPGLGNRGIRVGSHQQYGNGNVPPTCIIIIANDRMFPAPCLHLFIHSRKKQYFWGHLHYQLSTSLCWNHMLPELILWHAFRCISYQRNCILSHLALPTAHHIWAIGSGLPIISFSILSCII